MPPLDLSKDYFKTLGIPYDADDEVIKKAYRALAKKFHPDKNDSPDAEEKFKEIKSAYDFLESKDRREIYNREREKNKSQSSSAASNTSSKASPQSTAQSKSSSESGDKTNSANKPGSENKGSEFGAKTESRSSGSTKTGYRSNFDFRSPPTKEGNDDKKHSKTSPPGDESKQNEKNKKSEKNKNAKEHKKSPPSKDETQTGFKGKFNRHEKFVYGKNKKLFEDVYDDILSGEDTCHNAYDVLTSVLKSSLKRLPVWECDEEEDDGGIDLRFSPPRKPDMKTSQRRKSQVYGGNQNLFNDPELDPNLFDWSKPSTNKTGFNYDSDGSYDEDVDDIFPCMHCSKHFNIKHLNSHEKACRETSSRPQSGWKHKQDTFRRLVREDKLKHKRNRSTPDPPQHGFVQCQWCGLRIKTLHASAHIAQCRLAHSNLPSFGGARPSREHVRPTSSWSQGSCSNEDEDLFAGSADENLLRFMASSGSRSNRPTFTDRSPPKARTGLFSASNYKRSSTPGFGRQPKINLDFNINEGCQSCRSRYGHDAKFHCNCGSNFG